MHASSPSHTYSIIQAPDTVTSHSKCGFYHLLVWILQQAEAWPLLLLKYCAAVQDIEPKEYEELWMELSTDDENSWIQISKQTIWVFGKSWANFLCSLLTPILPASTIVALNLAHQSLEKVFMMTED